MTAPAHTPVSIVTGAGSGIGLATARLLARAGHAVVLAGRRRDALERAAAGLGKAARTLVVPTDMGDPAQVEQLAARTLDALGRIDNLVNNAGVAPLLPIDQSDAAVIESTYRINAIGPAILINRAWPVFLRQRSGCIVNVSTIGTLDPFAGFFVYASSKAALNLMAASCAKEGAAHGIRAFAVAPGAVETPMLRALFPTSAIPAAACLRPEDVAQVIADCIAGRRDADNGRVIPLSRS